MTEIWNTQNILEVGCGTGKLIPIALNMKRKDACYLGIDMSPMMIKLAKESIEKKLLKLWKCDQLRQMDVRDEGRTKSW